MHIFLQQRVTRGDQFGKASAASRSMIPGKKAKGHRSLTGSLDSKILGYVREHTQLQLDSASDAKSLGVPQLYNLLQAQDGQLRRLKKIQLEASIQRALNILRTEIVIDSDGESFDSDFEGIEDLNLVEVKVLTVRSNTVLTLGYECPE